MCHAGLPKHHGSPKIKPLNPFVRLHQETSNLLRESGSNRRVQFQYVFSPLFQRQQNKLGYFSGIEEDRSFFQSVAK